MKNIFKSTAYTLLGFGLMLIITQCSSTNGPKTWKDIKSAEEVCEAYPDHMRSLMLALDLERAGLEKVKQAFEKDNLPAACKYLLDYYQASNNAQHLRKDQPKNTDQVAARADTTLKNVFVVQNVRGEVPYGTDGHRDWYYKGPNNDREWAWLSNRHSQIRAVLSTYFETGNTKYVEYIDLFLRDFIIKSMPYPAVKSSTSVWRGLEVAARAKVWSQIFYSLLNSEHLSPSTRLLMLSSLPDHAHYNRNFHGGNNWLTMEISALATVATNFPEFKESKEWLGYSVDAMVESMKGQVYADGVQTELTSHYHNVSMFNFELFKDICDRAGQKLPDFFNQTIEDMYSYIAHAVRPDGFRALNNDGDRGSDREIIIRGAKKFNNTEWEYLATNGKSGSKPLNGPSYFYPWAGQVISRSGYDADAHWSFFDIGPWGSGHQHNDMLHISISAYGKDLLVDAGRFAYTGEVAEKFRGYARGTQGHNLILIDGNGQAPGQKVIDEPISADHFKTTDEYDYAWNSFDQFKGVEGKSAHTRAMFYVRDNFWVVVDNVETDRPRNIQSLWHWHPRCEVQKMKGNVVMGKHTGGQLQILPVGNTDWKIDMIKGQEQPEIQGWYSNEYNQYEPNVASIYSTQIESDKVFVWLLMPSKSEMRKVKAEIIAQSKAGVRLKISDPVKGIWTLNIPYADSNGTSVKFKNISN
jgi:hypothetical protein